MVITWPGPGAITICIQVQKGGEVPTQGLRMQAPDKKGEKKYFRFRKNIISMTSSLQHAETDTISVTCGDSGACRAPVILICCTCPVLVTCKCTASHSGLHHHTNSQAQDMNCTTTAELSVSQRLESVLDFTRSLLIELNQFGT